MQAGDAFETRSILRELPEVGLCSLRVPTFATERVLWPFYDDEAADASEFVDALVSHTLLSPRLSYHDVHELPASVRAALRQAVAATCSLPAAAGGSDAGLLAAMRARRNDLAHATANRSASFSAFVGQWLEEMRERLHAWARGADVGKTVLAFAERLSEVGELARRVVEVYDQHPLAFVLLEAHCENSFELLLDAVEHGDHVLADAVQSAMVHDCRFMTSAAEAVEQSEVLTAEQKDELSLGIQALSEGRASAACRLLMGGVESALWAGAIREGVIDSERRLLKTAGPSRPRMRIATSVNSLLDEAAGLVISSYYRHFLHDKLFNGQGHELRHGRTHDGADEYAKWAFIALLGWLDRWEHTDLMVGAGDRLDALLELPVAA